MPAGILYNAQTLGNVLAFYAFCHRRDEDVPFIEEHSQTLRDYSRINYRTQGSSLQYAASKKDIAQAALEDCDFDAATKTIPLMLAQVCYPGQVIARMLAELSHYVFWLAWRQKVCTGEVELHPAELSPHAYSAEDLALLACWHSWVANVPMTRWEINLMAQGAMTYSKENTQLLRHRSMDPANIVACIDTPTVADTERYCTLTLHLYHSISQAARDTIWIDIAFAYGQGIWFLEHQYPVMVEAALVGGSL